MRYAEDVNHIAHTHTHIYIYTYIYIYIEFIHIFHMHIHNTIYIYWYIYISVYSYIILISHPEKLPKRSSILDLLDVSQPRRIWGKMFLSLEKYPLKGWNPMNSGNLKVFSSEFWGWSIRFPWWMSCFASTKKLRQLRVKLGHWYMMLLLEQWWSLKKNMVCLTFEIEGIWDGCR